MKIFIYACENFYGGLHGIEDFCIEELETYNENSGRGVWLYFDWDTGGIRCPHIINFGKGGKIWKNIE